MVDRPLNSSQEFAYNC